jgi:hypothetical protein
VGYLKVILAPVLLPCHMSNLKQLVMQPPPGTQATPSTPHVDLSAPAAGAKP